jgi:hypothetical protein
MIMVQIMGACINFKDCPAAMKYIEDFKSNSLHNSSLKTLREAYCGKSPTGRKVICERIPECYQPTDKNYCVKSKDCCVASRLLDTKNVKVRKMLRQSRCDQESGEIKVKCGFLLETEENFLKETLSTTTEADTCVTPNGLKGRCIPVKSCPTFSGKPVTKNYLDFLKISICDRQNRKICCGLEENVDHICGLDNAASVKIGKGKATVKNEFPWAVVLKYTDPKLVCGGTLINSQFVLTAGHCLLTNLVKVRIGGNYQNESKEDVEYDIIATALHPNYQRIPLRYDIGILKIQKVSYQENIRWVCLPSRTNTLPSNFTIVGNGQTEHGDLSNLQLKASVSHIETFRCEKTYRNFLDSYSDFIICALGVNNEDACPGDSGGPLISKGNTDRWHVYGLVSAGVSQCSMGVPGIYTRVDKFLNWINVTMKKMLRTNN